MKFLFFSFLFVANLAISQTDTLKSTSWEDYFEKYKKNNEDYNYIYYYNTKGGNRIKFFNYFKCNDEFVLTYKNFEDSTFTFTKFKSDILFNNLEKNLDILKKFYRKFNPENSRKNFDDRTYNMIQIGIRFKNLHFNHFEPISDLELSEMPSEDTYTKGQIIINELAIFFEKQFNK